MEKRKVFKISIIDKEISRTEFDRNTFYTSDSELTLVFKLIEKDYTYDHGEILLYNEDDKSFVTRPITKKENDFVYKLDNYIIPHYGTWKAQLQLVKDGDVYTSKPFEFNIVNDLSSLAPQPTLTDINNWSTLKQSANELIDEMQDIIVDIEKSELERANKENYRQQSESERENKEIYRQKAELERVSKENSRQQAESERVNKEKTRKIAELERENKENTRQQAESKRQSTFETNEKGRQTTFETAEQERQSAELIRAENEEERVLNYENMQETIDMIGKVKLTSTFENGDFSKGTINWMTIDGYRNRFEVVDGVARNIESPTGTHCSFIYTNSKIPSGHITYHAFRYKQTGVVSSRIGVLYGLSGTNLQQYYYPTGEDFKIYTGIGVGTDNKDTRLFVNNIVNNGEYSIFLDYFFIIDLTATFGEGNEPSKATMDWIVNQNGYFEELTLRRDDIQQYEINQLRKAVISLGGA